LVWGCGFEPVGVYRRIGWKLGEWHDVAWMQRAFGVEQDPPPEPR
jgi:L-amino acid N-acyltransferase YncA